MPDQPVVAAIEISLGDDVADFPVAGRMEQQPAEYGLLCLDRMRWNLTLAVRASRTVSSAGSPARSKGSEGGRTSAMQGAPGAIRGGQTVYGNEAPARPSGAERCSPMRASGAVTAGRHRREGVHGSRWRYAPCRTKWRDRARDHSATMMRPTVVVTSECSWTSTSYSPTSRLLRGAS